MKTKIDENILDKNNENYKKFVLKNTSKNNRMLDSFFNNLDHQFFVKKGYVIYVNPKLQLTEKESVWVCNNLTTAYNHFINNEFDKSQALLNKIDKVLSSHIKIALDSDNRLE